ncbi:MAG: hypothetical protein ACOYIR_02165 [Christensenellales bacterium]|jgi:hypothetical protein
MSIMKCPRCDINFIREEEQYCSICKREMKGEMPKEELAEMCIECGEHPAIPGDELCIFCFNDRKESDDANETDDELIPADISDESDDMSLDKMEIVPLQPEDIPEDEREEIHKELGFDEPEDEDLDALDDDDLV